MALLKSNGISENMKLSRSSMFSLIKRVKPVGLVLSVAVIELHNVIRTTRALTPFGKNNPYQRFLICHLFDFELKLLG